METDPPIGGDPIALSPATYARHDAAVSYIETMNRTRVPLQRGVRSPGIIPAAWAVLAAGATITAGSGLSLGSGSVKLSERDGTVADDAEPVDVANAGAAIDGGTTGKILRLSWVDGEWCVTCPGGT